MTREDGRGGNSQISPFSLDTPSFPTRTQSVASPSSPKMALSAQPCAWTARLGSGTTSPFWPQSWVRSPGPCEASLWQTALPECGRGRVATAPPSSVFSSWPPAHEAGVLGLVGEQALTPRLICSNPEPYLPTQVLTSCQGQKRTLQECVSGPAKGLF